MLAISKYRKNSSNPTLVSYFKTELFFSNGENQKNREIADELA